MDIFAVYGFDETLENEGVWFTLDPESEAPARVKVGALNSENYQQCVFMLRQKHLEALNNEATKDVKSKELLVEAMAETVLLGWENVTLSGEALPYSKENAAKLLKFRQFREAIMMFSMERDNYRAKQQEDDSKN